MLSCVRYKCHTPGVSIGVLWFYLRYAGESVESNKQTNKQAPEHSSVQKHFANDPFAPWIAPMHVRT